MNEGVVTLRPEKKPTPRAIIANIAINLGKVILMDLNIVLTYGLITTR